jgi:HTH-type transcriptional regulator / antitoxin HigA
MNIKPIRTEEDHKVALAEIERLWDAEPGTADGDTFEILATLVDVYERTHTPILPPNSIEAIKFRMEQQGTKPKRMSSRSIFIWCVIGVFITIVSLYHMFLPCR